MYYLLVQTETQYFVEYVEEITREPCFLQAQVIVLKPRLKHNLQRTYDHEDI